jgi:hypothetical protein
MILRIAMADGDERIEDPNVARPGKIDRSASVCTTARMISMRALAPMPWGI